MIDPVPPITIYDKEMKTLKYQKITKNQSHKMKHRENYKTNA